MKYEAVIGLEVHVQVRTASKMFCSCPNRYGAEPNTLVCPVCLGYPGTLPVPNHEAILKAVRAGLLTECTIAKFSKFDRKSYFYPDLAKNYQISQYDLPFCTAGRLRLSGKGFSGAELPEKYVGITRIHLEEDPAKLTHSAGASGADYNRSGVPLLEVVSEPDMRSADEAYAYLTRLKEIMQYGDISDCDMEKGQMRCDVNISLRPVGQKEFGTKIELKNLNSFRAAHRAVEYEIWRQADILDKGGSLRQETRGWNDDSGESYLMRTKEQAHDYRYFPDPDLMPVTFTDEEIDEIRRSLPELPEAKRTRFVESFGLTAYDAEVLTLDRWPPTSTRPRGRAGRRNWSRTGSSPNCSGCSARRRSRSTSAESPRNRSPNWSISSRTGRSTARSPRRCSPKCSPPGNPPPPSSRRRGWCR